jgi:hypothetical protein
MKYKDREKLKIGDKVINFTNKGGGFNYPLKIGKTYTYDGVYNCNGGFLQLQEPECIGHGYDICRFATLKQYRKMKVKKLNNLSK